MMTRTLPMVDMIGGPVGGDSRYLEPGETVVRVRVDGCWHQYRLQPTDMGLCLVWEGIPVIPNRRAPAERVA